MGRDLLLRSRISISINEQSIKSLFAKANEVGFLYIKEQQNVSLENTTTFLSVEEAANKIITGLAYQATHPMGPGYDFEQSAKVIIKAQDTFFDLYFSDQSGVFSVTFSPSIGFWYKANSNYPYHIDWERYINLMFTFYGNLPILKVETFDSYYDD